MKGTNLPPLTWGGARRTAKPPRSTLRGTITRSMASPAAASPGAGSGTGEKLIVSCSALVRPLLRRLRERRRRPLVPRVALGKSDQHADPSHAVGLLRPCRARPARRAAKEDDEPVSCRPRQKSQDHSMRVETYHIGHGGLGSWNGVLPWPRGRGPLLATLKKIDILGRAAMHTQRPGRVKKRRFWRRPPTVRLPSLADTLPRCREPPLRAGTGPPPAYRLLAVSLRDLPDELRPGHVDGAIDGPRLGARIVLEDFHHQCGVIGEDHAGLQHAQKSDLSFSLAESAGRIDGHVSVETLANSGNGGERRADFKGDAREDQFLAPGRSDGLCHLRIVERVHRRAIDD